MYFSEILLVNLFVVNSISDNLFLCKLFICLTFIADITKRHIFSGNKQPIEFLGSRFMLVPA